MNKKHLPRKDGRRANLARHRRVCTICAHPERDAIEQAFLDWQSPAQIIREFKLASRTSVYRHADATGLFERRARNTRFALGVLIEHAQCVEPTAADIIRAVHAFTRINDRGEWIEPARQVVRYSQTLPGTAEPAQTPPSH
jgi:hypothetical protein